MKRFGEKLRILRQQQGLTQKQLGDMLDVHQTHVWRLEQSKKTPNAAMILKIAEVFRITPNQLMLDDQEVD